MIRSGFLKRSSSSGTGIVQIENIKTIKLYILMNLYFITNHSFKMNVFKIDCCFFTLSLASLERV